jgi:aminopeptidase N
VVSIDSYVLRVAVHANGIPFSCRARWGVRNAGDKAKDGFTFYLHPELVLREIRDGAGTPLTHEASIKAYDLAYTGDIVAHTIEFPDPIKPGETRTLTAAYDGRFSPSDARGPSDYMRIDEQGVYLRGTGYSIWFPVQEAWDWNAAATFEVVLDVPSAWRPLAFGDLISEEVRGDRNVSHWSTGSPWPLLFCHLAATEWDVIEGTTLRVYHRRTEESRDAAIEYADVGERLLQFYHTNYGDRVETGHFFLAELCPFGGISAGNVIGLPTNRFADVIEPSRSAATWTLLAHELVHAFAIPAVVNDGPAAALLIEGFPSYYHALALQAVLGNETYVGFVRAAWKEYHDRREAAESSASDLPPEVPLLELADRDIPYYKDVFLLDDRFVVLLDRLRNMIGPEIFLRGTRIFLDRHRTAPARFADFISTLESVSGERLGEFVDRWFGSTEALPEEWAPN